MPSTRKIAAQAGVSVGTVSRVLNNKAGVSEDVRRRVLEIAQELNYTPAKRVTMSRSAVTHIALLVRPLGDCLYLLPPLSTPPARIREAVDTLVELLPA